MSRGLPTLCIKSLKDIFMNVIFSQEFLPTTFAGWQKVRQWPDNDRLEAFPAAGKLEERCRNKSSRENWNKTVRAGEPRVSIVVLTPGVAACSSNARSLIFTQSVNRALLYSAVATWRSAR